MSYNIKWVVSTYNEPTIAMTDESNQKGDSRQRSSPRVVVSLPVEVEISGQKQHLNLISKDIGGGGIFLRTTQPASLWSRVNIFLKLPEGGRFHISGEVVRSVSPEKSRATGRPAGMAVAFDESSRSKKKELVELVLELCSQRRPPSTSTAGYKQAPASKTVPQHDHQTAAQQEESDELLDEIDKLLESVDIELEEPENDIEIDIDMDTDTEETAAPTSKLSQHPHPSPSTITQIKTKPKVRQAVPSSSVSADPAAGEPNNEGHLNRLHQHISEYKRTRKGTTYYHILGVPLHASTEQIETAYQNLLEKLRPQCSPDLLPAELLQELTGVLGRIRKAFAILSKPDRREAYDFLIDDPSR